MFYAGSFDCCLRLVDSRFDLEDEYVRAFAVRAPIEARRMAKGGWLTA